MEFVEDYRQLLTMSAYKRYAGYPAADCDHMGRLERMIQDWKYSWRFGMRLMTFVKKLIEEVEPPTFEQRKTSSHSSARRFCYL